MNTPQDLIKWLNEGNTDKVNEVLFEISRKDKRRLHSRSCQDEERVRGRCSIRLFNENDEIKRIFLFNVWTSDKGSVLVIDPKLLRSYLSFQQKHETGLN
jgi:hypothetical protein